MDVYILLLLVFGVVVLLTAWLPMVLRELPLSLPILCIALGAGLSWSVLSPIMPANPLENGYLTQRLTEFVVIVALVGAGLKIDRPVGWRSWILAWRLLGVAMPLTIVGIAFLGWSLLGLDIASAVLLGAALAPTDPVLASDVQVGPPHEAHRRRGALRAHGRGRAQRRAELSLRLSGDRSWRCHEASGTPWFRDG